MIPAESRMSSIRAIAGVCLCRYVVPHLTIHLVEYFRPIFLIYLGHILALVPASFQKFRRYLPAPQSLSMALIFMATPSLPSTFSFPVM